jgi:uncharacterized protein YgiM (DUF1202 family)
MKRLIFFVGLLLPFSLIAGETMYIQSNQAKLMSDPAFQAKQLLLLQRADKVEVLKKTKRWYQVRHQGETGWVSKLLLAPQPPLNKASVLKGNNTTLQAQARRRASSTTSAAATRGLRQANQPDTEDGKADFQAVDTMESVEVSPEEAKAFLDERSKQ